MGGLGSYFWRGGYELRRPAEDEGVVSSSEAPETTELGNEERRSKRRRTTNGEHEIGEEEGGDDVSGKSGFEAGPSDADLAPGDEAADANDLGGVVGRLWELEQPHRIPVELNSGARAASLYAQIDRCDKPLFATIGLDRLQGDPLSRAFIALLDNYCRDTNAAEKETDAEKKEILMFLKLMKRTPHFRYVHNVLASWGRAEKRMDEFMDDVYRAWFATYRLTKGGPPASSGFEHVFVGEEKYDSRRGKYTISGFHNWMQFYLEETQRRVNYLGYVGHNVSGGEEDLVVSAALPLGRQ
eukprot:TRINITY_DN28045_c0_g1_i1.p1 TRINITY_DN28045_c0_g1~~TRINITY_DN28045_c0_g1_i1.p1  ORF type:complete len:298 (+),score=43.29 TRINITY_DN28045_c0_g1_i1:125-1018(+)